MNIFIFLFFIQIIKGYEFHCETEERYYVEGDQDYDKKPAEQELDEALEAVEVSHVNRCETQFGKMIVRNLKGEVTEVTLNEHYYPVSSTSSYLEIPTLDGHYTIHVIKRTLNHCKYREFNLTIDFTDTCEPFYVYVIKKGDMVFQNDVDETTPNNDVKEL